MNTIEQSQKADPAPAVHLTLTLEQATALSAAAECYARLCIGQFEELPNLVRHGLIPWFGGAREQEKTRQLASAEEADQIESLAAAMKQILGYPVNGSHGIGHTHNDITATRAWEIRKVLDKALAEHKEPNPSFRGVNYDGLTVRYTDDPAPTARVASQDVKPSWVDRAAVIAEQFITGPLRDVHADREADGRGLAHLRWMAEQLATKAIASPTKACRWLGYLQGAMVESGLSTLEAEKSRNLASGRAVASGGDPS